jgi:phosphopantetheinyl transferase (holo-ACP synthase)
MLGNDLVDLSDPEASVARLHPRFDARVFDEEELEAIRGSEAPARLRWILWAAKEAAYKVARKQEATTVFSPRRFRVTLPRPGCAVVAHEGRHFAVTIAARRDHVHAVARDGKAPHGWSLVTGVCRLAGSGGPGMRHDLPSAAVRDLAIARLAGRLRVPACELAIERDGRVPRLVVRGQPALADLSLSHHGRLVAFACELELCGGLRRRVA